MIYALFGLSGAASNWLLHAVRLVLTEALGDIFLTGHAHLADFRQDWAKRGGRATLLFFDIPEAELSRLIINAGVPILTCHDLMLDLVRYSMLERSSTIHQTIRLMSQHYSTLEPAYLHSTAFRVGPALFKTKLIHFLPKLAHDLSLELSENQIDLVCHTLVGTDGDGAEETVYQNIRRYSPLVETVSAQPFDAESKQLAERCLTQFAVVTNGTAIQQLDIPVEIFPDWDYPGNYLGKPQELTGPRRILTAGHSFHAPSGHWSAKIEIAIEDNFSGNEIEADILLGERSLAGIIAPLPATGRYSFSLDFFIDDAFLPLQLRIVLCEGAIEGKMQLLRVLLTRNSQLSAAE